MNKIRFEDFDLDKFLSRYLCGGSAIKEYRMVSRKRLALVDSGVSYPDQDASNLSNLIKVYNTSVQKLITTKITKRRLCNINKDLRPDEKQAGKFRTTEIWFGEKSRVVINNTPGPGKINPLIGEWITDVNDPSLTLEGILNLYSRFLLIHPFSDGNGRTGRVL